MKVLIKFCYKEPMTKWSKKTVQICDKILYCYLATELYITVLNDI